MSRRKSPTSSSAKDWNNGNNGYTDKRRHRKPNRNKGRLRNHWLSMPDNEDKSKPKVRVIHPSEDTSDQIGRKYARIPVGDKWVHAGCSVFVPKRVYKHFELVRRALSARMDTLIQADSSGQW